MSDDPKVGRLNEAKTGSAPSDVETLRSVRGVAAKAALPSYYAAPLLSDTGTLRRLRLDAVSLANSIHYQEGAEADPDQILDTARRIIEFVEEI